MLKRLLMLACWLSCVCPIAKADPQPVQVFILVGQSNMQGHAEIRTFDHMAMDPAMKSLLSQLRNDDGTCKTIDQVRIASLSPRGEKRGPLSGGFGADENKIGPEFAFGATMAAKLDQPILIIKAAWGGKSLHTDFRPPSAGHYQFNPAQRERMRQRGQDPATLRASKEQSTGVCYHKTIHYVRRVLAQIEDVHPAYDPDAGYELGGLVWFQGWNDMVDRDTYPDRDQPEGYRQYTRLLADFIRDVRRDLSAESLPFVIGVLGVGGPVEQYSSSQQRYQVIHQNFRDAMAAVAEMPEFDGTVVAVRSEIFWDQELARLRAQEAEMQRRAKQIASDDHPSHGSVEKVFEQMRNEGFSQRERAILERGVSNFEFHYLGSAKILSQIGRAFAEALYPLLGA